MSKYDLRSRIAVLEMRLTALEQRVATHAEAVADILDDTPAASAPAAQECSHDWYYQESERICSLCLTREVVEDWLPLDLSALNPAGGVSPLDEALLAPHDEEAVRYCLHDWKRNPLNQSHVVEHCPKCDSWRERLATREDWSAFSQPIRNSESAPAAPEECCPEPYRTALLECHATILGLADGVAKDWDAARLCRRHLGWPESWMQYAAWLREQVSARCIHGRRKPCPACSASAPAAQECLHQGERAVLYWADPNDSMGPLWSLNRHPIWELCRMCGGPAPASTAADSGSPPSNRATRLPVPCSAVTGTRPR